MIKVNDITIAGFAPALMGIRNSYASWDKADSEYRTEYDIIKINRIGDSDNNIWCYDNVVFGDNDRKLAERLVKAGEPHCKFRRMIVVWMNITAPLYWWKQFDTYKVGTVANSESTMHNICDSEFSIGSFSSTKSLNHTEAFQAVLVELNKLRRFYIHCKEKNDKEGMAKWFDEIIKLLPESYNQKRTVMLNYSVLASIYQQRKHHKLDEWVTFCDIIEMFPHSWLFTTNKQGTQWLEYAKAKHQAKAMRKYGFTVKEIADEFGVSEAIIINWIGVEVDGRDNTSERHDEGEEHS